MAASVLATTANTGNIETTQIEQGEIIPSNNGDNLIDNLNTQTLKETLTKTANQEGVDGLVKAFVEVVTNLLNSLSKIIDKLSAAISKTDKPTKVDSKAETKKPAKSKSKKNSVATTAKTNAETKAEATQATNSTTPTLASSSVKSANTETANNSGISAQTPSSQTISSSSLISEVDPKLGHSNEFLSVATNSQGNPEIYTEDGYIIRFEEKEQAWNIITPEGKLNRVWGDPHVVESDGDKWDFKERSSFIFGNNKATVETIPYGNGQTLSSKITIYNGDSRVSVSGIDKNKAVFETIAADAQIDDALREDGDIFLLGKESNGEDQFVLLRDVAEKFDTQFAKQVGAGDAALREKYLTAEQVNFLKN